MRLNWRAEDVLRALSGQSLHEQSWVAHGVAIDSRSVKQGDLFVALAGPAHDGHDHIAAAFEAGAVAAIAHRTPSMVAPDAPLVMVEDTFKALQDLGRAGRARAKASIVAITGSVGKTSTKEQLKLALDANGATHANEGSFNNHWGVPLSLARLPEDARFGVFEIGMNHAGELGPLSREVRPSVALITNVEAVHLEFFGTTEAIATAKAEIFEGMTPDGQVVLNRDNPHFAQLAAAAKAQGIKKIFGFGRDPKAEARLVNWTPTEKGGLVEAVIMDQPLTYTLGAPGVHFALNSLGALLAASLAGGDICVAAEAMAAFHAPYGRGTRKTVALPEGGEITIIDESFNASPVATRAAIRVLADTPLAPQGRRILVLGDMRELGEAGPMLHAGLAEDIRHANIDLVHSCGTLTAHLHDALPKELRGHHAEDSAALAPHVAADVKAGDIVLVKGSKSMLMPTVIAAIAARGSAT